MCVCYIGQYIGDHQPETTMISQSDKPNDRTRFSTMRAHSQKNISLLSLFSITYRK